MCMYCRSLFVLLYFFFLPLCCLFFFDARILIAPLVSSNSSSAVVGDIRCFKRKALFDAIVKHYLVVSVYIHFVCRLSGKHNLDGFGDQIIIQMYEQAILIRMNHLQTLLHFFVWIIYMREEFEDTKRVIRIRKSKMNRQHNGQKKNCKRTNNDLQNIYIKLKIE